MIKALLDEIIAHGDRGAVVPISRYDELKREIEDLKSEDHHRFVDWMLEWMDVHNEFDFESRSLITVVTPSPKAMLRFIYNGKAFDCVVPPQYLDEESKANEVSQYLNAHLEPLGRKAVLIHNIPRKLLAVHSGLGQYGRNNICFNEEFGSYIGIYSYVSDLSCNESDWFPAQRMDTCQECRACITACPTNAIDLSHRIINTSICLTAINEAPGEFPEWLNKDAHNSLIGCTKCQDCCPGNAVNKNNIVMSTTFSEDETAEILSHQAEESYSDSLAARLKATGIYSGFTKVLPRNLKVLLQG